MGNLKVKEESKRFLCKDNLALSKDFVSLCFVLG